MAKRKPVGLQNRIPKENIAKEAETNARILDETLQGNETGDLSLSPIEYRDPRDLKPSPFNTVFEPLKDSAYWANLRRDIEEAGAITDPLLILPGGELMSGHSRRRVAIDLLTEGRGEFAKVPVRVVLTDLDEDERRKRVYLGNLSRFEIDPDTRLALYAEIYPDYFERTATGRPEKGVTVTRFSVAQAMGVSEETAKKEKAIYRKAKGRAKSAGRSEPTRDDIAETRKAKNAVRRKPKTPISSGTEMDFPPVEQQENNSTPPTVSPVEPVENRELEGPDVFTGSDLRQRFDLLREEVKAAFVTAVKKADAMDKPSDYLNGIEAVAKELQGTVSVRSVLELITKTRGSK